MQVFKWLFKSRQPKKLDSDKTYLLIQFLTEQQKIKKDLVLQQIKKKYSTEQHEDVIIPYTDMFPCSFRYKFNNKSNFPIKNNKNNILLSKIQLKELISNLTLSEDQQLQKFLQTYYNGVNLIYQNKSLLQLNDVIELQDQIDVETYIPEQVVEIVYHQRSLWQRIKTKTKNFIKNLPSVCLNFIKKLIWYVLTLLGLNTSITSLLWKSVSSNMIVQALSLMGGMILPGWMALIFTLVKRFF